MQQYSEIDLLIAKTEGRLEALRELQRLQLTGQAEASPAAIAAAPPTVPAVSSNGHTNGSGRIEPDEGRLSLEIETEPRQTRRNPPSRSGGKVERARSNGKDERINQHAERVSVEEPRQPVRVSSDEYRTKIAHFLLLHGPRSGSDILRGLGLPTSGSVIQRVCQGHAWFERDTDMKWHLTTEGHQAVRGNKEE